jgi:hypothetical protein
MIDQDQPSLDKSARKVVDSTIAIAFARFFMPVALAVIGWFMVTTITDMKEQIRDGNNAIWMVVKSIQGTVNSQTTDIAVLKNSKDETSKALDRLTAIVDRLDRKP